MSVGRGLGRLAGQLQQQHIRSLEASFIAASSQFGSYNFREYFTRKTTQKFSEQLPRVLGTSQIDDKTLAQIDPKTQQDLHAWWSSSLDELAVLQRASVMNKLFEAPKLVVENAANSFSNSHQDQPPNTTEKKSSGTIPDQSSDPKSDT
ncbi:hypothetical protein PTTG_26468 [Puccinia triticina 1-1 BBBD Race 1]|uniref:Uncharacterized protein n=2 Tax=Puccinia triticina TaxID=208348 RepID=A0A180GUD3_PUCT1|nr:uncharacterized protein PtA15_5A212 [Puccinia triticina]OAV96134.1 hypothetical protein PTTG_26468 [Puccinia triticina 1-1 BBBD Race 1]WAQ84639.1 hypothetical protein PtA15_5A212 [Puccinia triticina]WAR57987.1 hypothetical protein PtB15_5B217 [Puccinia triticina]